MTGLGAMMAGGNPDPERGRATDDFYATPPEVTQAFMHRVGYILKSHHVWEPCAGDGAMGDQLLPYVGGLMMTDINPQRSDIGIMDFLKATKMPDGFDTIITNPPFNIAAEIIEHAFEIGAQKLALLLKSTFWHAKSRQELFSRYRPTAIHPLTWRPDFKGLGRPTMECQWVYWAEPCKIGLQAYPSYIPLSKVLIS